MGGTDNIKTSIGHKWQQGPINAPTVLNAGMNLAQFWDGRAKDLKEQAGGPIANPGEMASTHDMAVKVIKSIPQYQAQFDKAFGSKEVDIDRVTTAIAAFEETLVTPDSALINGWKVTKRRCRKRSWKAISYLRTAAANAIMARQLVVIHSRKWVSTNLTKQIIPQSAVWM